MCRYSSKSGGGVPFQPLGDLTWNDPSVTKADYIYFETSSIIVCFEKRENLIHKRYSGRQLFLRTLVGLKAISHPIPHIGKLLIIIEIW